MKYTIEFEGDDGCPVANESDEFCLTTCELKEPGDGIHDVLCPGLGNPGCPAQQEKITQGKNIAFDPPALPMVTACRGCGHVSTDPMASHTACCPDAEYVPVGEVIRELWGKAFGKAAAS